MYEFNSRMYDSGGTGVEGRFESGVSRDEKNEKNSRLLGKNS